MVAYVSYRTVIQSRVLEASMLQKLLRLFVGLCMGGSVALLASQSIAQEMDGHISSLVEKLSRNERVFGVSTYDLSLENARTLAREDIDYLYVDMEHGPMDFAALQTFLLGMTDRKAIFDNCADRAVRARDARVGCQAGTRCWIDGVNLSFH